MQCEAIGSLTLPEPTAPVAVYCVRGFIQRRAGVSGRGARSLSRFVGRAAVHQLLADVYQWFSEGFSDG